MTDVDKEELEHLRKELKEYIYFDAIDEDDPLYDADEYNENLKEQAIKILIAQERILEILNAANDLDDVGDINFAKWDTNLSVLKDVLHNYNVSDEYNNIFYNVELLSDNMQEILKKNQVHKLLSQLPEERQEKINSKFEILEADKVQVLEELNLYKKDSTTQSWFWWGVEYIKSSTVGGRADELEKKLDSIQQAQDAKMLEIMSEYQILNKLDKSIVSNNTIGVDDKLLLQYKQQLGITDDLSQEQQQIGTELALNMVRYSQLQSKYQTIMDKVNIYDPDLFINNPSLIVLSTQMHEIAIEITKGEEKLDQNGYSILKKLGVASAGISGGAMMLQAASIVASYGAIGMMAATPIGVTAIVGGGLTAFYGIKRGDKIVEDATQALKVVEVVKQTYERTGDIQEAILNSDYNKLKDIAQEIVPETQQYMEFVEDLYAKITNGEYDEVVRTMNDEYNETVQEINKFYPGLIEEITKTAVFGKTIYKYVEDGNYQDAIDLLKDSDDKASQKFKDNPSLIDKLQMAIDIQKMIEEKKYGELATYIENNPNIIDDPLMEYVNKHYLNMGVIGLKIAGKWYEEGISQGEKAGSIIQILDKNKEQVRDLLLSLPEDTRLKISPFVTIMEAVADPDKSMLSKYWETVKALSSIESKIDLRNILSNKIVQSYLIYGGLLIPGITLYKGITSVRNFFSNIKNSIIGNPKEKMELIDNIEDTNNNKLGQELDNKNHNKNENKKVEKKTIKLDKKNTFIPSQFTKEVDENKSHPSPDKPTNRPKI